MTAVADAFSTAALSPSVDATLSDAYLAAETRNAEPEPAALEGERMMRQHAVITPALLAAFFPLGQPVAQTFSFELACTYRGGQHSFVVSGDYVKGEATISRGGRALAKAFVKWDFDTPPKPKLAVLVRGQGPMGEWRDLYVIDTAVGTFTHVSELYVEGSDKNPIMHVRDGTCVSTKGS